MSDQIIKTVTTNAYVKERCDICGKVLAKSFVKKHKKEEHSVLVVSKKKEECFKKKEEEQRKKEEEASTFKDTNEKEEIWSKILTSDIAPTICNVM